MVGLPALAAEANAQLSSPLRRLATLLAALAGRVPGAVGLPPRPPRGGRAADPDRAGRGLVLGPDLRAGPAAGAAVGQAQPDVGHAGGAGHRHLHRVQRAALGALPRGAASRLGPRPGRGAGLPLHRRRGRGLGADRHRGLRRPDGLRHPDAARLRDPHRAGPGRVAARGADRPARRADLGGGARALRACATWTRGRSSASWARRCATAPAGCPRPARGAPRSAPCARACPAGMADEQDRFGDLGGPTPQRRRALRGGGPPAPRARRAPAPAAGAPPRATATRGWWGSSC